MRATIRIVNETKWKTEQLREFALLARNEVFLPGDRKKLEVKFKASRGSMHGRASLGGSWSTVWLPNPELVAPGRRYPTVERVKLVLIVILKHELAHNAGAAGERWMRRGTEFGWGAGWEAKVAWAASIPLEPKEEAARPTRQERLASEAERLRARLERWIREERLAHRAVLRLKRRLNSIERRAEAALEGR